ncbi:hypothetical protein ACROYT_G014273 [Oculina patagonica]
MEEVLSETDSPPPSNLPSQAEVLLALVTAADQQQSVKARLPKLENQSERLLAGFVLTAANYEEAVQVLKKRYGKEKAIQQAHINDMLFLPRAYSDRDTTRMSRMYHRCEAHYRGLKTLGVDEETYASVVVPAVLQRLPENFGLAIMRRVLRVVYGTDVASNLETITTMKMV